MKRDDQETDERRFVAASGMAQPEQQSTAIVQVQLKGSVGSVGALPASEPLFGFAPPAGLDLSGLRRIANNHGLVRAEHSFRQRYALSSEMGGDAPAGITADTDSHKRGFVDLHFPPGADVHKIAAELRELPEVERAVPMPRPIPPNTLPTDPLIGASDQLTSDPNTGLEEEWYIFRCQADKAWQNFSGKNVVIADIDFGFLLTHQDLAPNLDLNFAHNSYDGSTNVTAGSDTDHGTAVLGLAGAASNAEGMAGFAWGATLWPIQANAGTGTQLPGDAFANAIDWVTHADSGGKRVVINLEVQTASLGNYEMVPAVNTAIQDAIAKGIVVCVAAGNGNKDAGVGDDGLPIPATGSILVGATAYDDAVNQRASFSNWGPRVVVAAPGDADHDVTCSTSANDAYRNQFGGTSGATPKVSGTVALMLEANPTLTHDQIKQILTATGTAIPVTDGRPIGVFLNTSASVQSAAGLRNQAAPTT
jgi:subtilisin family serine protease